MDNMRLRVLYSIGRFYLWYKAHHREIMYSTCGAPVGLLDP